MAGRPRIIGTLGDTDIGDKFVLAEDLIKEMNEMHRKIKDGCKLTMAVPLYPHENCFHHPSAKQIFTTEKMKYFHEADELWKTEGKRIGIKPFKRLNQFISGRTLHIELIK